MNPKPPTLNPGPLLRNEIRRDPIFRAQFHTMCSNIGVDPLASNKGVWAQLLGFGDFYYELGVQVRIRGWVLGGVRPTSANLLVTLVPSTADPTWKSGTADPGVPCFPESSPSLSSPIQACELVFNL